jgi:hypothetical protein
MKRALRTAAVGAVAMLATIALPTSSAVADPGFCGVRVGTYAGMDGNIVYTVRNRCNYGLLLGVRWSDAPNDGAQPLCRWVDGGGYGTYTSLHVDGNWRVVAC